jgi:hypothetical protein
VLQSTDKILLDIMPTDRNFDRFQELLLCCVNFRRPRLPQETPPPPPNEEEDEEDEEEEKEEEHKHQPPQASSESPASLNKLITPLSHLFGMAFWPA